MKTFLFIAALVFNLLLCFYPFQENISNYEGTEKQYAKVVPEEPLNQEAVAGLAYSDLLKNKASALAKP